MRKDIPVYNIVLNEDNPEAGLDFVSLVDEPAIMEMGLAFSHMAELKDTVKYEFKSNKDKQIVAGPAMIPDIPIYRFDEDGEFYVVFTKEVIEQLANKFNKTAKEYKVNIDHKDVVESAFIKSNWIIEDEEYDKSKMYGFNLPKGTWFLEVKVEDSEYWNNEVKGQNKIGFSVEGLFGLDLVREKFNNNNKLDKNEKMDLEQLKLAIAELSPEEKEQIKEAISEVAPEEVVEEVAEAVADVVEEQMEEGISEEGISEEEEVEASEDKEEDKEEYKEEEIQEEDEIPAEEAPEAAPELTEEAVAEMIQAKYDELLAMIAELKTAMEAPAEEEPVELSTDKYSSQLSFIKALTKKN